MPLTKATGAPAAPPRRGAPRASQASIQAVSRETPRDEARKEGLTGIGQAASAFLLMRGQYADAGAIGVHGPRLIRETVALARQNEPLGRALDMLSQAGPYTGIAMAALPLIAQIAVNHGRIEAGKAMGIQGVMSPAALEAQAKAELAEIESDALRMQHEAEKQLADLKTERENIMAESRNGNGA